MKNSEIDSKVKEAFDTAVPNMKNRIISDLGNADTERSAETEGIAETSKKETTKNMKKNISHGWTHFMASAAAIIVLVSAGIAALSLHPQKKNQPVASVMIDVNPSIEIAIGSDEKVVTAIPHNDDGNEVLKDMDLTGSDVK